MPVLILLILVAISGPAGAQVPPSPADVAGYSGLHAAAWTGNAGVVAGADRRSLEARDRHGRTPLHVAAFARRRNVIWVSLVITRP